MNDKEKLITCNGKGGKNTDSFSQSRWMNCRLCNGKKRIR